MAPQSADLIAIVDILGHDDDCPGLCAVDDIQYETCTVSDPWCSAWGTATMLASRDNLNRVLAQAWDRGFSTCALRTGQQLLNLLPSPVDATNPYQT